jgi:hypothetical protein
MQQGSQPASCNGNCGRVVHFPSRQKLFKHLREKHEISGFQRRGRESRKRRQEARSSLHDRLGHQQPRTIPGPHKQWIRPSGQRAMNPYIVSDVDKTSPATGASSPAMAPEVEAQGQSPVMASSSPATGVTLPAMASQSPAIGARSSAKASPSSERAPASANSPLPGLCPVSSATGASSSAKASTSLARAPTSPAMAPTAAGDLPGGAYQADTHADAWAQYHRQQSRAHRRPPQSAWSAAMAPRP